MELSIVQISQSFIFVLGYNDNKLFDVMEDQEELDEKHQVYKQHHQNVVIIVNVACCDMLTSFYGNTQESFKLLYFMLSYRMIDQCLLQFVFYLLSI